jgi:hypothetical protein
MPPPRGRAAGAAASTGRQTGVAEFFQKAGGARSKQQQEW